MRTTGSASSEISSRLDDLLLKRNMFSPSNQTFHHGSHYMENLQGYVWGKPMMRMMLEVQCLAVAMIVTTQVWILSYYGSRIFEKLIGDDIALPLLYLGAIIFGTLTYVRPTYGRIAMSLILYCLVVYYSIMVTNVAMNILITPGLAETLQETPQNTRVWIPWAIGFALHLQVCISSIIISCISIRDMYRFNPTMLTRTPTGVVKHNIVVEPITVLNNNNWSTPDSPRVIVQYI